MAKTLKLDRGQAIALLEEMGFEAAKVKDDKKILKSLKELPDLVDEDTEVEGDNVKLLEKILKVLGDDGEIELTGEVEGEAEEKPAKAKKGAKPAKKAKAAKEEEEEEEEDEEEEEEDEEEEEEEEDSAKSKKAKKGAKPAKKGAKPAKKAAKKSTAEKDDFGCRVGSMAAKINAALGKKGKTADVIAKESKTTPARVKGHLQAMIAKKKVKHTDKGYVVA